MSGIYHNIIITTQQYFSQYLTL